MKSDAIFIVIIGCAIVLIIFTMGKCYQWGHQDGFKKGKSERKDDNEK